MKTAALREKLHRYIEMAGDKKLKAIYTMVEDDAVIFDPWKDKGFIAELDRRIEELESGKTKGYTWDEVKEHTAKTLKTVKRRK